RPEIFETLDRILTANSPDVRVTEQEQLELFGKIFTYATELTADKRRNPADDIWSTLASAVVTDENGEQLSIPANELEIFFYVLTFAGSDTTKNALAAGLQAFVANPGEMARYRADETIRPSAVEEVLRWATPVAFWTRSTKVDIQIDGVTIPKGDRVVSMLRSANRDEEVFADPFTFDIGRTENQHVTFGGGGPHHCLGAMLARRDPRGARRVALPRRRHHARSAEGRLPQPDQQHVDLRPDGDFAYATLGPPHSPFGLVPMTPCAANRSRSVSVSPHSWVSTSLLC